MKTTDLVARRQRERQGRKGRDRERERELLLKREVLSCGLRCSMLRAAELERARRSITVTNYGRLLQIFSVGRGSGRSGSEDEGLIERLLCSFGGAVVVAAAACIIIYAN